MVVLPSPSVVDVAAGAEVGERFVFRAAVLVLVDEPAVGVVAEVRSRCRPRR